MPNVDDYKAPFPSLGTKPYATDIDKTLSMGTWMEKKYVVSASHFLSLITAPHLHQTTLEKH